MGRAYISKRLRTDGKPAYRVRFDNPTSGRTETLGTFDRKLDAERELTRLKAQLDRGAWFDPARGRELTFEAWVEQWDRLGVHRRASTRERDLGVLAHWWLPALGDVPLAEIRAAQVREVVASMVAKGLSPVTVRTHAGICRTVLGAAVENGLIEVLPWSGVRLPTVHTAEDTGQRIVTLDEMRALAEAAREPWRLAVWLAGLAGLRWSEVAGLRVSALDLERSRLHVREAVVELDGKRRLEFAPPKSRAGRRTVPMAGFLVERLTEHLGAVGRWAPADLVLEGPSGGPMRRDWFRQRVLGPARAAVGLTVGFHELRHTAGSLWLEGGASLPAVAGWLGHEDVRVTAKVYAHTTARVETGAMDYLDAQLRGPIADAERG